MSSPVTRGPPPLPSAVAFVHRNENAIGDAAANSGHIFIGPRHLPRATSTLAWFMYHGFSVRIEYFADIEATTTKYPGLSSEITQFVLDKGAAILAASPSIIDHIITPSTTHPSPPTAALFTSPFSS